MNNRKSLTYNHWFKESPEPQTPFYSKNKTFLLKMSSLLPALDSGYILQKLNKADFLTFHGRIEFANVVVVTQLMMHAISFLGVISLRMTEIYFSTLTLKLSTLILLKTLINQQIFLLSSCKIVSNCMKHIDNSYLLKVDLIEGLPSLGASSVNQI